MRGKRWLGWRLVVATAVLAASAVACSDDEVTGGDGGPDHDDQGGAAGPDGDPENYCEGARDGQLVWAHQQEPRDLHADDHDDDVVASWIQQPMLEGLYGVSASATFIPELLEDEIRIVENDDDTVTLHHALREGLTWSDGAPLTSHDVQHTFELITDEGFSIGSRRGYEQIDRDSWELTSDTEFSYTTEPFSGYRNLFARIFPAHVLSDAATANEALATWEVDGEPIPSSGPLIFEEWNRGVSLSLTRNGGYHGAHPEHPNVTNRGPACVSGVRIDFVDDTGDLINALRGGVADIIFAQPRFVLGEHLTTDGAFTVLATAGPRYEHWSLNLFNPHLADINVREALAYAIDKDALAEALYTPLFGDGHPIEGLGNAFWVPEQPHYEDNAGVQGYGKGSVEEARALLERSGYELNPDIVYEHPERGPLRLRVGTTGGDELRELGMQVLQAQLAEIGLDIQIDNVEGDAYFAERPFAPEAVACAVTQGRAGDCGIWDIAQFDRVGGAWPGAEVAAFRSGSEYNVHGYANDEFDARADECRETLGDDALSDCFNELDRFITTRSDEDGIILLPLLQKPTYYAYADDRVDQPAVVVDARDGGPLVNVVDFRLHG